eukprot:COSAG06_NODE_59294_length_274_cov_1.337143_1_plen_61_part_10
MTNQELGGVVKWYEKTTFAVSFFFPTAVACARLLYQDRLRTTKHSENTIYLCTRWLDHPDE